MKNLMIAFALSLPFALIAQSVVKELPAITNDYILLEKTNPSIDYWTCNVYKHTRDQQGNVIANLIYSFKNSEDYFMVPDLSKDHNDGVVTYSISAYDVNDNLLFSEQNLSARTRDIINPDDILGPLGDVPQLACFKTCNGKVIQGHTFPNSNS